LSFRLASGDPGPELARMRESGAFVQVLHLERLEDTEPPVLVRPVVGDEMDAWMPAVHEAVQVVQGVVAFSGADMAGVAHIAADAAAWFGDRGKAVVLVDASVGRPVIGKPLPEDGDEGLVDAVLFGVSFSAVVRRTLSAGVRVVTAGSHPLSVASVFQDPRFAAFLRELAEEALVLLVLPAVQLRDVVDTLDAAVCIAGEATEADSLASSVAGLRLLGILVGELAPEVVDEIVAAEPDGVTETELSSQEGRNEPPVHAQEEAPEPVVAEPVTSESVTPEPVGERVKEVTAPVPQVTGVAMAPSRRSRRVPGVVPVVALLICALVLWWFADGQDRFSSRPDAVVATRQVSEEDGELPPAQVDALPGGADQTDAEEDDEDVAEVHGEAESEPSGTEATGAAPDGVVSGPGGSYLIMVSSHYREVAASLESAELVRRGVLTEVVETELGDRGTWYRVVVSGGYPTLAGARSVLDIIKSFGYEGAWIERAPRSDSH